MPYVIWGDDETIKIIVNDPVLTAALEVGELVMRENHELLQALA